MGHYACFKHLKCIYNTVFLINAMITQLFNAMQNHATMMKWFDAKRCLY